jgi:phage tail-like protein
MPATAGTSQILSAPRFIMTPTGGSTPSSWTFQEMSSISMEVEAHEFIFCDNLGAINHTKQYGKTAPPKVTLKKPMDLDRSLWTWHMCVQAGNDMAKLDVALQLWNAGSPDMPPQGKPEFQWTLQRAWPSKLEVSGMKAGTTDTGVLTVTFACDMITIMGAQGKPTGAPF